MISQRKRNIIIAGYESCYPHELATRLNVSERDVHSVLVLAKKNGLVRASGQLNRKWLLRARRSRLPEIMAELRSYQPSAAE